MEEGGEEMEHHLEAEARYSASMLRRTSGLQRRLLAQMLSRLPSEQVRSCFCDVIYLRRSCIHPQNTMKTAIDTEIVAEQVDKHK